MIHPLQQGFLGYWQLPWILLFMALVVGVYGRYENRRLKGVMLLSLSAYVASTALSIVALVYVLILPVKLVKCHEVWNSVNMINWIMLIVCSATLTWASWVGIRKMSGDL